MSGRFTDVTAGDWEWIRSVNLDGVVNGCAVFAPGMLARGRGRIVNLSSGLAYLSPRTAPAYVATKAAVLALSRSLRGDFAQYGVGVTAICPGITDTPIVDNRQATADLTPISFGHELTRLQRTGACSSSALKKSDFFPALKGIPTSRRSHHPTDRWIEARRWRGSIRAARES
jgi:NAD(P)-dependent dehydrogenase (short-subunit alcohol dehydrogenase family)